MFTLPSAIAASLNSDAPTVHVICGGASGASLFPLLLEKGFRVTVGVTNLLDTDEEAARALGLKQAVENPFSEIGTASVEAARELINAAESVIVAEIPFGAGNLSNLQLAVEAQQKDKRILLLGSESFENRDYSGGAAQKLWHTLLMHGASRFDTTADLINQLDGEKQ